MNVVILPDHDEPGRKYPVAVAAILAKLSPSPVVKIVELPGLTEGDDLVEWIAARGDAAEPDAMRQELEVLADAVDAIKPERPEPLVERFEPFPVDTLPEPVRSFVQVGSRALGCDAAFVAVPMLPVLGAALGQSRALRLRSDWTAPSILWTAIVAESGSMKSPAARLAFEFIERRQRRQLRQHEADQEQHERDVMAYERAVVEWKKSGKGDCPEKLSPPVAARCFVQNLTMEALGPILHANPRGVLDKWDELDGWLGMFDRYAGGKGSDRSDWLTLYNGKGDVIVDRKTGPVKTLLIRDGAVWLAGGMQLGILRDSMTKQHRAAGLFARLLPVWPPTKQKRWTEAAIAEPLKDEMRRLIDGLFALEMATDEDGEPCPLVTDLTPEAKRLFVAYYDAHNAEQVELEGDLSAAWAKLEEVAARLALIFHYCREVMNEPGLPRPVAVDADSMRAAIRLTGWFKREARRVYTMLDESNGDGERRKLAEWIDRKGGSVTARELQMGPRRFRASTEVAELALEDLVTAGFGRWEPIPTTPKGGRDSRLFILATATEPRIPA